MTLKEVLQVPEEQRDQAWENNFFKAFSESQLEVLVDSPVEGPDGWPYLVVKTSEVGSEPAQKVMQWLADRGVGMVVNPDKEYPDYAFSYGMIWSFRETGYFYKPINEALAGSAQVEGELKAFGAPTEEYLPQYVRAILKEFFNQQGVSQPRLAVASVDGENYDLLFSLESLGSPQEEEHAGILQALSWFLPPHYSLVIASEQGLPAFYSL